MEKNTFLTQEILSRLFDLQRFAPNDRLEKIISDVESRYGTALSDDDLSFVNAAGEVESMWASDKHSDGTEEEPL